MAIPARSVDTTRSAELVKDATLKVYAGAPHGLMVSHREQFNADLLAFIQA